MSNKVLVLGSTGNVGRMVVRELVAAGVDVVAASRQPAATSAGTAVESVEFSLARPDTFDKALAGVDRIFIMLPSDAIFSSAGGSPPYELMYPFIDFATRDRGHKIVLLSVGGISAGDDDFHHRHVERRIEQSGVRYVFVRPNWFMDNFHTLWLALIKSTGQLMLPAGDARAAFIDCRDIGAAAACALRTDRFDGQAIAITGPQSLTHVEVAAALSQASGRLIRYAPLDGGDFIALLRQVGVPKAIADYTTHSFERLRAGIAAQVTEGFRNITGNSPRTFERYASDHASYWQP